MGGVTQTCVGDAPPIFFGLAKENGPCTVQKKNALGIGKETASKDSGFLRWARYALLHIRTLSRELGRGCSFVGAGPIVFAFLPAAATLVHGDSFQRKGPRPLPLCRFKGWSRRGKPKSPSWRAFWTGCGPFSPRGENGGHICPAIIMASNNKGGPIWVP